MPVRYEYYILGDDQGDSFYGARWYAQTFTPSVSHIITSVKILITRYLSPGTLTVSIRATSGGFPTGGDLVSGTTNGNTVTLNPQYEWREIFLGAGYKLNAGTQYAIVFGTGGNSSNFLVFRYDLTAPTYSGGDVYRSLNSGGSWTFMGWDAMFEEWGVAAPKTAQIADKLVAAGMI